MIKELMENTYCRSFSCNRSYHSVAKPAGQFGHACNLLSLPLVISLEIVPNTVRSINTKIC